MNTEIKKIYTDLTKLITTKGLSSSLAAMLLVSTCQKEN